MMQPEFDTLLELARDMHETHPALMSFCPFPDDVTPQAVCPHDIPSRALLGAETGLWTDRYADFRNAVVSAAPFVHWRETYKDSDVEQDFLDRFGCYTVIGKGGPFTSQNMWAWIVYMPAGLYYPWHHHPGEEMYMVVAGEADFFRDGQPTEHLRPGQVVEHGKNQSHAAQTHAHPVLAYVVWRNRFDVAPVLTEAELVV